MRYHREIALGAGVALLSAGVALAGSAPRPLAWLLLVLGAGLLAYASLGPKRMAGRKVTDTSYESPERWHNIAVNATFGRALIAIAAALTLLGGLSLVLRFSSGGGDLLWAAGTLAAWGSAAVWIWSRERQERERAGLPLDVEQ